MTQDEILKELRIVIADNQQFTTWTVSTPHLVELVNRAVELEREACAKVCDEYSATGKIEEFDRGWLACAKNVAAAIRARGNA